MIRTKFATIAAVAVVLGAAAAAPNAAELTAQEREKLLQYLTTTRDNVIAESAKLSDAQWNFKPAPDRWSVGEVVEHLALAETFIFDAQQKTAAGPAAPADKVAAAKGKDDTILKVIPDRTQKAQAPEPIQPAKRIGDRAAVVTAFRERRGKTIDYARQTKDDLRARVSDSPLGPVDAYQWLLFIGAHTERHLAQLKEVKAHAQFPK